MVTLNYSEFIAITIVNLPMRILANPVKGYLFDNPFSDKPEAIHKEKLENVIVGGLCCMTLYVCIVFICVCMRKKNRNGTSNQIPSETDDAHQPQTSEVRIQLDHQVLDVSGQTHDLPPVLANIQSLNLHSIYDVVYSRSKESSNPTLLNIPSPQTRTLMQSEDLDYLGPPPPYPGLPESK